MHKKYALRCGGPVVENVNKIIEIVKSNQIATIVSLAEEIKKMHKNSLKSF